MLLRHIHYFLAVAEHRSFTRAAAALFVSQPALSQQIRQLEEKLGAVLLDRSGREMRLTDAGEVYYRYARRALQDLSEGERAIHDVQDLSRGELRIAITPTFISYLVGPLVQRFFQAYPCVRVNIQEMSQERIEEGLLDDAFDLGIAFDEVRSPDIATQPLHREMLALVVNEQHPLANSPVIAAHQLAGEALILLNETFATRGQIDRYCRHQQVQANIVMQANSLSAVLEVIRSTPLATLLPANIANLQAGLKAISLQPALLERQVVLLHRDGSHQSRAARAFSELTRDYCEGELSDSAPG